MKIPKALRYSLYWVLMRIAVKLESAAQYAADKANRCLFSWYPPKWTPPPGTLYGEEALEDAITTFNNIRIRRPR